MDDDERIDRMNRYRERSMRWAERWEDRRERRAEQREAWRQRRAERRACGSVYPWLDPRGYWGTPSGPSEMTLRLRAMLNDVDALAARVATLETIAARTDARVSGDISRLARGAAGLGSRP